MRSHHRATSRNILLSLLGLGAVVIGYFVASGKLPIRTPAPVAEETLNSPVPVRTAKAETRKLSPILELIGTVQPDPKKYCILASATNGSVEKLLVNEGDRVAKNDIVIQLDERPAQLALDRTEAAYSRLVAKPLSDEVDQARQLVEKTSAAHALAESRLKKAKALKARDPELVPDIELLDEQRNEQSTRAEWEIAQAQQRLLEKGPREELRRESQIEVEAAKLQLEYCKVRAPIAGEVVAIKATVGERADVGTPLATIFDASEVLVQARIPSDHLASVVSAMQSADEKGVAIIHCASFKDETFTAGRGWLSEQTEGQTGDVPIKLRVSNPKGLLRAGMTVKVDFHEPTIEGLAIPEAAVTVNEEGHRMVTAVHDGKAVPTEISVVSESEPLVRDGGWIRVLNGLQPGDEVAVQNGYALPKDTPVTVLPPEPSSAATTQ